MLDKGRFHNSHLEVINNPGSKESTQKKNKHYLQSQFTQGPRYGVYYLHTLIYSGNLGLIATKERSMLRPSLNKSSATAKGWVRTTHRLVLGLKIYDSVLCSTQTLG